MWRTTDLQLTAAEIGVCLANQIGPNSQPLVDCYVYQISVRFQRDIFVARVSPFCCHDSYSRQQYTLMHWCNSTLNALSSINNQDANLPLAMRFYNEYD